MNDDEMRDSLYRAVYERFVGPIDPESTELIRETKQKGNNKAINPLNHYAAGILFPQGEAYDGLPEVLVVDEDDSKEFGNPPNPSQDEVSTDLESSVNESSDWAEGTETTEPIALCNTWRQSAISVTFAVPAGSRLSFSVQSASYREEKDEKGNLGFRRKPISWINEAPEKAPKSGRPIRLRVAGEMLEVVVVRRREIDGVLILTAALVNARRVKGDIERARFQDCYFQAKLSVQSDKGFCAIPARKNTSLSDEAELNALIYRGIKNFAIGHGCAGDWKLEGGIVSEVFTSIMPVAETRTMKATRPELADVSLDLFSLSRSDCRKETLESLSLLCDRYEEWVSSIEEKADLLEEVYAAAAKRNIEQCRACLKRMRAGVRALGTDSQLLEAFLLTNKAMLDQHLHYSVVSGQATSVLEPAAGQRSWRPFQMAFILMNIQSISVADCEERDIVDLIWFPTGGGKTEAYLGLSAFTLILERLRNEEVIGSTVIMRYTLRLLTTQQFQRAASLICALEVMRRSNPVLGDRPFTVGLWLGSETTPNTWSDAEKRLQQLSGEGKNGFPIECCPWCGASIGAEAKKTGSYNLGVRKGERLPKGSSAKNAVRFNCPREGCDFASTKEGLDLPFRIVDEDVYKNPPSLLIGTADKFAMIPYRPESYRIFGINGQGDRVSAPKLIIQDELHLISGPLGSMAANFETLVGELCRREIDGKSVMPKIVASTATISRAKEQCSELFACGPERVFQFPPSGIDAEDSFFSLQETEGPGRRYVGVYAPNVSFASASIALYTELLWDPVTWDISDEERDPYWTTVGYYGTIRELGQAATWVDSDIRERLHSKRTQDVQGRKRYLNRAVELTSRIDASRVSSSLKQLEIKHPEKDCVDLCLATNMISVGLDVGRLGLMMMAGQPKSTAEYIQASSRVGRSAAKGIVFVLYGAQRPRDRSHYENFKNFHEKLYGSVEPTSLTGFSEQVRERCLPGTFVGLYRSFDPASEDLDLDRSKAESARRIIEDRVNALDPDEYEDTRRFIDEEIIDVWNEHTHNRWSEVGGFGKIKEENVPLIYPRGNKECEDAWAGESLAVPTSLRNVEGTCDVIFASSYQGGREQ